VFARRVASNAMRLLPVTAYGRVIRREAIGLCYHVVGDRPLPHVSPLYPFKTVAQFRADLLWLRDNFRFVSYPELMEARDAGRPLGPNRVFLSFDDGYAECFSVVRPMLLELGVPCTFFITTDVIGNRRALAFNQVALCVEAMRAMDGWRVRAVLDEMEAAAGRPLADPGALSAWIRPALRNPDSPAYATLARLEELAGVDLDAFLRTGPYLTAEQVKQMAAEGFSFGGHSRLHWHLGSIAGPERVEHEIVESCRVAAALSGASRVPFAFPYDGFGLDRGLLAGVLRRNPFIAPVFGTGGVAGESDAVLHRMIVDHPPRRRGVPSTLPGVFRDAYLSEALRLLGGASAEPPG
jgi:peptidoglycan/xylan/chitin deacetylase (PgdA/CDA1 family)